MKPFHLLSALILVALLLSAPLAQAAFVPATLSYQGSLYNTDGSPFNGVKNITFRLYTVSTAGSAFWTEVQNAVNITNGRFATLLGNSASLNPASFSADVWLGIQVEGETSEMSPRQKMTSVAFAFNASTATTATTATTAGNGVPVGGIIMWSGTVAEITAMDGWVLCDGTTIKDAKTCPDLRGRFIIGAGGSYAPRALGGNEKHFHKASGDGGDLRAMIGLAADNVSIATIYSSPFNPNTGSQVTSTATNAWGSGSNSAQIYSFSSVIGFTSQGFMGPPAYGANAAAVAGSLPPYYALAYIMRTK